MQFYDTVGPSESKDTTASQNIKRGFLLTVKNDQNNIKCCFWLVPFPQKMISFNFISPSNTSALDSPSTDSENSMYIFNFEKSKFTQYFVFSNISAFSYRWQKKYNNADAV